MRHDIQVSRVVIILLFKKFNKANVFITLHQGKIKHYYNIKRLNVNS